MKDIQLLETCNKCGKHITLMVSIRFTDNTAWAVKRCLECGNYPLEEVVRIIIDESENDNDDKAND